MNETLSALMQQVFPGMEPSAKLNALAEHHSKALRDLRVNVSNVLQYSTLSEKER